MKEERLGERRVELQIFINPLVGSLSRPHVPMQIKSNTHTRRLHIFKLCHLNQANGAVLCHRLSQCVSHGGLSRSDSEVSSVPGTGQSSWLKEPTSHLPVMLYTWRINVFPVTVAACEADQCSALDYFLTGESESFVPHTFTFLKHCHIHCSISFPSRLLVWSHLL